MNFAKDELSSLIISRIVRDHIGYRSNYHKSHL